MSELRHYARRSFTGHIEIVDRQFDWVRCLLPYDYAYTSNSQQWDEARRICEALEGPMIAQGIVNVVLTGSDEPKTPVATDASAARSAPNVNE